MPRYLALCDEYKKLEPGTGRFLNSKFKEEFEAESDEEAKEELKSMCINNKWHPLHLYQINKEVDVGAMWMFINQD